MPLPGQNNRHRGSFLWAAIAAFETLQTEFDQAILGQKEHKKVLREILFSNLPPVGERRSDGCEQAQHLSPRPLF